MPPVRGQGYLHLRGYDQHPASPRARIPTVERMLEHTASRREEPESLAPILFVKSRDEYYLLDINP